jgi:hypothetical protein
MHVADQIENNRVVVSVLDRLRKRIVGTQRLACLHEKPCQVCPRRPVCLVDLSNRPECRNSCSALLEFKSYEANQKVRFRNILARLQDTAAALACLVGVAGLKSSEAFAQRIAHPDFWRFFQGYFRLTISLLFPTAKLTPPCESFAVETSSLPGAQKGFTILRE